MAIHGPTLASTFVSSSLGIKAFKLGNGYSAGEIVTYAQGWYQSRRNITVALNVPPADLTNWKEFLAHGIESFGEHLVDELGRVNLSATPTPLQAEEGSVSLMSSGESTRLDTVSNTVDLEAELVSIRGATNLFSQNFYDCLLYTSPSPRDRTRSRMPSSA